MKAILIALLLTWLLGALLSPVGYTGAWGLLVWAGLTAGLLAWFRWRSRGSTT